MKKKTVLGQNFLKDENIAKSIVNFAQIDKAELVLEIGPGKGILTRHLSRSANKVIAIEFDKNLVNLLGKSLNNFDNVEIVNQDVLSFDFSSISDPFKIVANLPYNISTMITMKLLETYGNIITMVLMFQKEVAERLYAKPGSKKYGALSVKVQYYAQVSFLMDVENTQFNPIPAVHSTVVKITPRRKGKVKVEDEAFFFKLIKCAFTHKRKTIINNLKSLSYSTNIINSALSDCGIEPSRRAESISIEEFATLANYFFCNYKN